MKQHSEARDHNAGRKASSGVRRAPPPDPGANATVVGGGQPGKGAAQAIDSAREVAYWRKHYSERAYVEEDSSYDDYGPAYAFGVDAFSRYPGASFEAAEPEMSRQWIRRSGASMLGWDDARYAARDAWNRLGRNS